MRQPFLTWLVTHPQIVGEHERKDGDAFIVIRAGDRTTYVSGYDCDESGCQQTRTLGPQLLGEQVGGDRCEPTEKRRQEHAHFAYVNGYVERVEGPVYGTGCDHEARVNSTTHNASQRVPCALVEPIQEVVEAVGYHVVRGSVVEPRVELVYYTLVSYHRKQSGHKACEPYER